MEKREAELKSLFTRELKRQLPGFLILSYATNGAPDREIVGGGVTTRWECKHGTPAFKSPGDQELMCMRLALAAHCRYVIWSERKGEQKTLIVHPRQVHERQGWNMVAESSCEGFDMRWLVEQIRTTHNGETK